MLFISTTTAPIHMHTNAKLSLSIHGYDIHTGIRGPKPHHNPIWADPNPNSSTQKRKRNKTSHPTPNAPGSSKSTRKHKRAERRQRDKRVALDFETTGLGFNVDYKSIEGRLCPLTIHPL
jgi:hypothetical protein